MQRRTLLKIGLLSSVALTVAGGGLLVLRAEAPEPAAPVDAGQLDIFRAVARGVLAGTLPADAAVAQTMLESHLQRVDAAVRQFPPHVRAELDQLLMALKNPVGRRVIASLSTPWAQASVPELHAAFEAMRLSNWSVRQQAYHALRDLTSAAYFAEPGTWASLGYPGPTPT
jgi:hypothetical protein